MNVNQVMNFFMKGNSSREIVNVSSAVLGKVESFHENLFATKRPGSFLFNFSVCPNLNLWRSKVKSETAKFSKDWQEQREKD